MAYFICLSISFLQLVRGSHQSSWWCSAKSELHAFLTTSCGLEKIEEADCVLADQTTNLSIGKVLRNTHTIAGHTWIRFGCGWKATKRIFEWAMATSARTLSKSVYKYTLRTSRATTQWQATWNVWSFVVEYYLCDVYVSVIIIMFHWCPMISGKWQNLPAHTLETLRWISNAVCKRTYSPSTKTTTSNVGPNRSSRRRRSLLKSVITLLLSQHVDTHLRLYMLLLFAGTKK